MEAGLVGLRAELLKKRVEAGKFSGQRGAPSGKDDVRTSKKAFQSSNTGVSARAARDAEQVEEERMTEAKARDILEEKAAMYDRLHSGVQALEDDTLNQKYLVNFQKKIVSEVLEKRERVEEKNKQEQTDRETDHPEDYDAQEDDDEWVEYQDAFGRTRECLRKDLPTMLNKDKELKRQLNDEGEAQDTCTTEVIDLTDEALVDDLQREARRQQWERQEEINATKKDLHYQDVLFDEARAHGAGFMRFSNDEKERQEQMTFLKELRAETKAGAKTKAAQEANKKAAMKARLEKVRQRKRLKMGLPVKDDDRLKTPPPSDNEEENETVKESEKTYEKPSASESKKQKVREWDVGKEDMEMDFGLGKRSRNWGPGGLEMARGGGGGSAMSQEEWVDQQRAGRRQEFAPPSLYKFNK